MKHGCRDVSGAVPHFARKILVTDLFRLCMFHCRFPFYYEIKIILVIWLLSPATKGSSILYRKFVHPMLSSREQVGYFNKIQIYLTVKRVNFTGN